MAEIKRFYDQGFCHTVFIKKKAYKRMYNWEIEELDREVSKKIREDFCEKCIHKIWQAAGKSCASMRFKFETKIPDIEPDYDPFKEAE